MLCMATRYTQSMNTVSVFKNAVSLYHNEGAVDLLKKSKKFFFHSKPVYRFRLQSRMFINQYYRGWKQPAHPLKKMAISPDELTHLTTNGSFERTAMIGRVIGGSWDTQTKPFENHHIFQGLKQRFDENKDWEETDYYQRSVEKINKGKSKYNCSTKDEFKNKRCKYLDDLYESISENGYQDAKELDSNKYDNNRTGENPPYGYTVTHNVGVNIARDGSLLINHGFHRLSIAKILGIDRIPVCVIVRHKDWQQKRDNFAGQNFLPKEFISHPDLQDLPS